VLSTSSSTCKMIRPENDFLRLKRPVRAIVIVL
jgi:hypothetical protein